MIEEEVEDLEELGEDEPEQEQEMYEHFDSWSIGYPT